VFSVFSVVNVSSRKSTAVSPGTNDEVHTRIDFSSLRRPIEKKSVTMPRDRDTLSAVDFGRETTLKLGCRKGGLLGRRGFLNTGHLAPRQPAQGRGLRSGLASLQLAAVVIGKQLTPEVRAIDE